MLSVVMLSVVMLSVVILSVVMLSVVTLSFVMLSVVKLSVVMLSVANKPIVRSVVKLNVVTPSKWPNQKSHQNISLTLLVNYSQFSFSIMICQMSQFLHYYAKCCSAQYHATQCRCATNATR